MHTHTLALEYVLLTRFIKLTSLFFLQFYKFCHSNVLEVNTFPIGTHRVSN